MGRIKQFNEGKVLDIIMKTFHEKGFQSTSLSDLVERTQLNKSSLYASFGNKDEMFALALKKYTANSLISKQKSLNGLTFLNAFFETLKNEAQKEESKWGCLIMNSALEFLGRDCDKSKLTKECWNGILDVLKNELSCAKKENKIKKNVNIEVAAKWLVSQAFTLRQISKFIDDPDYSNQVLKQVKNYLLELKTKEL